MEIKICLKMLLCSFFVYSCCKGSVSVNKFIFNNTNHNIIITPYKSGILKVTSIKKIDAKTKNFSSFYCYNDACFIDTVKVDSMEISFDGLYVIVHQTINNNSNDGIPFVSNRNLFNYKNYIIDRKKSSRCNTEINTFFTFTEQDYIDAKAQK